MGIAEQLKSWRAERALTFRQLSDRSYVDIAYLHRLENNLASRPGRNVVLRVAIGLGLDIENANDLLLVSGHLTLLRENATSAAPDDI